MQAVYGDLTRGGRCTPPRHTRLVPMVPGKPAQRKASKADDSPPRYFVWVRGLVGPEPQKWAALDFGVDDWKREQVLACRELPEQERHHSLAMLARLYPAPPYS